MFVSDLFAQIITETSITPEYFKFKMSFFELEKLTKYIYQANKQRLEELRLIKHAILLPHSAKGLELTDVMKFAWDEENEEDEEFQLLI